MNQHATRVERRLQLPMLIIALLVIPSLLLEGAAATALGWFTWLAFVAEAIAMLVVVDNRSQWLREHPLEVAIVVLTPPLLPASLQAARVFRTLRVLRLLRFASLLRRFTSPEGVRDAGVLALVTVLGGGTAFAAAEKTAHLSPWDGVWWAISTVTTVGYGDISPTTTLGRVIAICVMLAGIGFIAILTAAAAERFVRHQRAEDVTLSEIATRLDAIEARLGKR